MSGLLVAAPVCVAGGVGAAARFVLDGVLRQRLSPAYPLPTIIINLSGSLLLGLLTGLTLGHLVDPWWQLVLGTGLMGGYTTFSTASFEVARLVEERRWAAGTTHALGTAVTAISLAGGGLALGLVLGR